MVYGDLQIFDIIIFAGIAIFLVYRLKNVLGKRTGFEKKPHHNKVVIEEVADQYKKTIPELDTNLKELKIAYDALEDFSHKAFLDGARLAFETIINAFNAGDKKILKDLLTSEVLASFKSAIDDGNNNPEYQFYSLVVEAVDRVVVDGGLIRVTIRFVSEQFKENDESTIIKKKDVWTFEKKLSSKDPKWLLSST